MGDLSGEGRGRCGDKASLEVCLRTFLLVPVLLYLLPFNTRWSSGLVCVHRALIYFWDIWRTLKRRTRTRTRIRIRTRTRTRIRTDYARGVMKFKPNQTRTYDGEGFKQRAACLCFRNEREDEVRLSIPSNHSTQPGSPHQNPSYHTIYHIISYHINQPRPQRGNAAV